MPVITWMTNKNKVTPPKVYQIVPECTGTFLWAMNSRMESSASRSSSHAASAFHRSCPVPACIRIKKSLRLCNHYIVFANMNCVELQRPGRRPRHYLSLEVIHAVVARAPDSRSLGLVLHDTTQVRAYGGQGAPLGLADSNE